MPSPPIRRPFPATRGFTLVEVLVVLLIFGVVVAMAAAITRGVVAAQKRSLTATRIATVDAALAQFVQQQKRLPCPGNGTLVSSHANAGTENGAAGACVGNQQFGVVPWRALGITEVDATDGWDRRLTYRVDPTLTAANGMDMSWCDPAGTEAGAGPKLCTVGCTASTLDSCTPPWAFLNSKGLQVRSVGGAVVMDTAASSTIPHTGAAYVLISAGESGGGAYLSSGQLGASSTTDGNEEQRNYASAAYAAGYYYVDDSLNETPGATHFDDVVSRPSVLSVATRAGLGPRAH